jgi:hypothetical protein
MMPIDALKSAKRWVAMAEEAKDDLSRRRYQRMAQLYLKGWDDLLLIQSRARQPSGCFPKGAASGRSASQQS